ncbi:MAG: acyltransferase [Gallionella sp.]|nr:acyltransferase [Gallionella sp.]
MDQEDSLKMFNALLRKLGHDTTSGQIMPGIDGLRALAVAMVVIFHIHGFGADSPEVRLFGMLNLNPWLTTGHLGVDLFFALSGFLLMIPWAKNIHAGLPTPPLRSYFQRRFYRIAPAYYAQLAILFLVLAPIALTTWHAFSPLGIVTVFTHFTFTHYLFPLTSAGLGINGALWTLTVEVCFYLVLPFIARFFVGEKALFSLLIALLVAETWKYLSFHELYDVLVWLVTTMIPQMASYRYDPIVMKMFLAHQFPAQVFNFAIGMYLAGLFCQISSDSKRRLQGPVGSFLVVFLLAVFAFQAWSVGRIDVWQSGWIYVWFISVSLVCAGLIFFASFSNAFSEKVLGAHPLRLLGIISYSVYLWHFPVIYFAKNYWMPDHLIGIGKFYYLMALCIPLTLLIGYFSYRYIELPFLSLGRGLHGKK